MQALYPHFARIARGNKEKTIVFACRNGKKEVYYTGKMIYARKEGLFLMKIALACDPAGVVLKDAVTETLVEMGAEVTYFGIHENDTTRDYPVFSLRAAKAVASGEYEKGIIICGTGVGISMAANKVKGIRCCCCSDYYSAKMTRAHNDANMLALGGRVIAPETAKTLVEVFMTTEFEGDRHQRRVDMITAIENGEELE